MSSLDPEFEEFCLQDKKVAAINARILKLNERLQAIWAEHRYKADEVQRRIAFEQRNLRAEKAYARVRFAEQRRSKQTTIPSDNAQPNHSTQEG